MATGKLPHVLAYTARDWIWISSLGLLGTYIYYLLLYLGYARASGLEVLIVQHTWPAFVVLFSMALLGEKLSRSKLVAMLFGFVGVCLVLTKGNWGDVNVDEPVVITLVAAGAACFALFSVLSKSVEKEPTGVVAVYFLVATIASCISMFSHSGFASP